MFPCTRRHFIYSSAVGTLAFIPGCHLLKSQKDTTRVEESYYLANKAKLTSEFAQVVEGSALFLEPELGKEQTREVSRQANAGFSELLLTLPDVGGGGNIDIEYVPVAAWYVALYAPLRNVGKTAEDVGKLVYELNRIELENLPRARGQEQGAGMFAPDSLQRLRQWAEWTQQREYPANWVAQYISGNGVEFDFGYDYAECALVKYFKAQGVPELAPYVCLNVFLKSRALGTGLQRSQTLAQGDPVCNFRYKRNRPVLQNWDTEIELIRSRV